MRNFARLALSRRPSLGQGVTRAARIRRRFLQLDNLRISIDRYPSLRDTYEVPAKDARRAKMGAHYTPWSRTPEWKTVTCPPPGGPRMGPRMDRHGYDVHLGKVLLPGGARAVHFTAYTLPNRSRTPRPVTFCFGGGPGASSAFLQFGGIGPVRLEGGEHGIAGSWSDNFDLSILEWSDLVFFDPPGTGHSDEAPDYFGFLQDSGVCSYFVEQFLRRHRPADPPETLQVDLLAASYGGLRAAGMAHALADRLRIDNLILFSPALDYRTFRPGPGNPLPYSLFLPNLAAIAHRSKQPSESVRFLGRGTVVEEAKKLAQDKAYLAALAGAVPSEELVKRWEGLTGLSFETGLLKGKGFQVDAELFARVQGVSMLDGRFDSDHDAERIIDPHFDSVARAFSVRAAHFNRGLDIQGASGYDLVGDGLYTAVKPRALEWDWAPFEGLSTADAIPFLREARRKNPNLKITVFAGRGDLLNSPETSEFALQRLGLTGPVHVMDAGHMSYMDPESLVKINRILRGLRRAW